jgi:hypothetical protein
MLGSRIKPRADEPHAFRLLIGSRPDVCRYCYQNIYHEIHEAAYREEMDRLNAAHRGRQAQRTMKGARHSAHAYRPANVNVPWYRTKCAVCNGQPGESVHLHELPFPERPRAVRSVQPATAEEFQSVQPRPVHPDQMRLL